MKSFRLTLLAAMTLALTTFSSCQKSDTNALQEAQLCLNKATPAMAQACVAGIASNTTSFANSLRCSSIFISEGYGAANAFVNALDSINTTGTCGGGCSSTVNALTTFKFSSAGVTAQGIIDNNAKAAEAFAVCSASNIKAYTTISSLFKIGTLAAMLAGVTNPTPDQIKTQISNLPAATLGDLVITTSATVCADTTKASAATKAYCTELAAALASPAATPTSIGACLKLKLVTPGTPCAS